MKTLDEAWRWYRNCQDQVVLMSRLAGRYWAELPWAGLLERDNRFRNLEAPEVQQNAEFTLDYLDDISIVVLFSVFESQIRERIKSEVTAEMSSLKHPALVKAAQDTIQWIDEGSFARVTEPFKALDANLVEEVAQVRRYRNWVSHGKRNLAPSFVDPKTAYDRLTRFIKLIDDFDTAAHAAE